MTIPTIELPAKVLVARELLKSDHANAPGFPALEGIVRMAAELTWRERVDDADWLLRALHTPPVPLTPAELATWRSIITRMRGTT